MRGRAAPGPDPLAGAVLALLVLACFGAFFLTQRLKHTPTAVQEVRLAVAFAPTARPGGPTEMMSFHIANTDKVTVQILDASGNVTATVISDREQLRYRRLRVYWNGHTGPCAAPSALTCASSKSGPLAAPGVYRLRISLLYQHLSIPSPNSFRLRAPGSRT